MEQSGCMPSLAHEIHREVDGALEFLKDCPCIETKTKFSISSKHCNFDFMLSPSDKEYVIQNHRIALVLDMKTLKIVELAIDRGSVLFFGTKVWFDMKWIESDDLHAMMFQQSTHYDADTNGFNPIMMMDLIEYNQSRM